jgi:hypothetical protein
MRIDVKSSFSVRSQFYGTEFYTFKNFVDYVCLNWFICFYEVVFRGNNESTLLCCKQIAIQYTTHFPDSERDDQTA